MRGAGAEDDQIVDREVEQKGDSDAARLAQDERQVGRLPDERRRGHVDDKAHAREDEEQHGLARAPSAPQDIPRTISEERRVWTECVTTCLSRWSPYHYYNYLITFLLFSFFYFFFFF